MRPLDGNAIAGLLRDVFGVEMTMATCVCSTCGASAHVAELAVYLGGPGTTVRCRTCTSIVMVFVTIRGVTCVDLRGQAAFEPPT